MIDMMRALLASILLCSVIACSGSPGVAARLGMADPKSDEDFEQLEAMKAEILAFIGDPVCSDVSDCAAVAFGSKPCGGPWEYLVYSTATVDPGTLAEMVSEYNELDALLNQRHGIISDCSLVRAPALGCVGGRCVAMDGPS